MKIIEETAAEVKSAQGQQVVVEDKKEPLKNHEVAKFIVPEQVKKRNEQFREMLEQKRVMLKENEELQNERRAILREKLKQLETEGVEKVSMMSYKVFYPKDIQNVGKN